MNMLSRIAEPGPLEQDVEQLLDRASSSVPQLLPRALRTLADSIDQHSAEVFRMALFTDDEDAAMAMTGMILKAVLDAAQHH